MSDNRNNEENNNCGRVESESGRVESESRSGSGRVVGESGKRKEQLFKKVPEKIFVESILKLFIPNGFQDTYYQFSRKTISDKNVVENLNLLVPQLREYYMNCKHVKYLENIDEKKAVTILRQLLRLYDYRVISMEKYYNGHKYLLYKIEKIEVEKDDYQKKLILEFD